MVVSAYIILKLNKPTCLLGYTLCDFLYFLEIDGLIIPLWIKVLYTVT
jgi:hypothetical protein